MRNTRAINVTPDDTYFNLQWGCKNDGSILQNEDKNDKGDKALNYQYTDRLLSHSSYVFCIFPGTSTVLRKTSKRSSEKTDTPITAFLPSLQDEYADKYNLHP